MMFPKKWKKKKKPKGKTARFSTEVKTAICHRDRVCILSGELGHSCHHVYFGQEKNTGDNRNDVDQWVLLSFDMHLKVHSCASWTGERQKCIDYLKEYYETNSNT